MEGVSLRLTLSEQMSIIDTSINLRDLLKVRDDDGEDDDGRNALAGLTLGAVLGCEDIIINNSNNQPRPRPSRSRTLLDIIKDEEESGAAYRGINNNHEIISKQKSWKSFKDRLRLGRAGSSSSHNPAVSDDIDGDCRMDISGPPPTLIGIQTSSFSIVSSSVSTTVPVQNVTDLDHDRENNNTEEINSSTPSSDHVITVPNNNNNDNNSSPSEPVVMRLSAALAAEREEQQRQTGTVEVAEQGLDHHHHQHQQNEELGIDQRGIGVVSTGQEQHQQQQQEQEEQQQPLRVSLMALLEETMDHRHNEMILLDDEEEEEMEEGRGGEDEVVVVGMVERERERERDRGECICCVCMVRHKGAAFIPCGHTFCRLCSRKLWVNRGNCPLCNGFILEILDIF